MSLLPRGPAPVAVLVGGLVLSVLAGCGGGEEPAADRVSRLEVAADLADGASWSEAEAIYRTLREEARGSRRAEILLGHARCLAGQGRADEALTLLRELVSDHPEAPVAARAGRVLERARETTGAALLAAIEDRVTAERPEGGGELFHEERFEGDPPGDGWLVGRGAEVEPGPEGLAIDLADGGHVLLPVPWTAPGSVTLEVELEVLGTEDGAIARVGLFGPPPALALGVSVDVGKTGWLGSGGGPPPGGSWPISVRLGFPGGGSLPGALPPGGEATVALGLPTRIATSVRPDGDRATVTVRPTGARPGGVRTEVAWPGGGPGEDGSPLAFAGIVSPPGGGGRIRVRSVRVLAPDAVLPEAPVEVLGAYRMAIYEGTLHRIAGRTGEAVAAFDRAVDRAPARAEPRWLRAATRLEAGRPGAAIGDVVDTVREVPRVRALALDLVEALRTGGHPVRAACALHAIRASVPEDEALVARQEAIDAEAWAALRAEAEAGDLGVADRVRRGERLLALDRFGPAVEEFDEALDARPDHVPALLGRARALLARGEPRRAYVDLSRVRTLDDEHPEAYLGLGEVHLARGEASLAAPLFSRAVALRGEARDLVHRGRAYFEMDQLEAAEEDFREATSRDPRHFEAWWNLARVAFERGDVAAAAQRLDRALRLAPPSGPDGRAFVRAVRREAGE